jgi:hypothetical protein
MTDAILYAVGGAVLGGGVAGLSWAIAKRVYSESGHSPKSDKKNKDKGRLGETAKA